MPDDKLDELVADLDALGLPSTPSHWRRNLMACTGIEFCKLSFAETRKRAQVLVPELEKRLEDINAQLDVPITVNINGCPNSCARIQVADIGFKGQMVDDGDGAGRGIPGPPGRQPRPGQRFRPQAAPAQGASRASWATTSTGSFATS